MKQQQGEGYINYAQPSSAQAGYVVAGALTMGEQSNYPRQQKKERQAVAPRPTYHMLVTEKGKHIHTATHPQAIGRKGVNALPFQDLVEFAQRENTNEKK